MNHIKDILSAYKPKIESKKIHFAPDIPQEKLMNAIDKYAALREVEEPLVLFDNTYSGNAEEGILLTNRRIYFRNVYEKKGKYDLQDVRSAYIKKGLIDKLYINEGLTLWTIVPPINMAEQFCLLVNEIANCIKNVPEYIKNEPMPNQSTVCIDTNLESSQNASREVRQVKANIEDTTEPHTLVAQTRTKRRKEGIYQLLGSLVWGIIAFILFKVGLMNSLLSVAWQPYEKFGESNMFISLFSLLLSIFLYALVLSLFWGWIIAIIYSIIQIISGKKT